MQQTIKECSAPEALVVVVGGADTSGGPCLRSPAVCTLCREEEEEEEEEEEDEREKEEEQKENNHGRLLWRVPQTANKGLHSDPTEEERPASSSERGTGDEREDEPCFPHLRSAAAVSV
ncbi:unnamed protein product [Merluccius merluccius]